MRALPLLLALLAATAWTQPTGRPAGPWDDWQPPEVTMPDPNAFDLYLAAFELIEQHGEPDLTWTVAQMREALGKHDLTLALLSAAIVGRCRLPVVANANQPFPYLARLRSAARLLAARARVLEADGRHLEAALAAVQAVHLAHDVATHRTFIGQLVSIACEAVALDQLGQTVAGLSCEDALQVIACLRAAERDRVPLAEVVEGETVVWRHMLGAEIWQSGESIAELERDFELPAGAFDPEATWRALDGLSEALVAAARGGRWADWQTLEPEDPVLRILAGGVLTRFGARCYEAQARAGQALAQLAVHAFWVERGTPPQALEALVPDYLPAVPADPFSGQPLRMLPGQKVCRIYSVGPDGQDDAAAPLGAGDDAPEFRRGDLVVTVAEPRIR